MKKIFDQKKRKLLLYGRAVLGISNSTRCADLGKNLGTVQVAGCNSDSTAIGGGSGIIGSLLFIIPFSFF